MRRDTDAVVGGGDPSTASRPARAPRLNEAEKEERGGGGRRREEGEERGGGGCHYVGHRVAPDRRVYRSSAAIHGCIACMNGTAACGNSGKPARFVGS
eukprot:2911820-Rhodomonas_salina.2